MPGRVLKWPEWPEFGIAPVENDENYTKAKSEIIAEYGEDALRQSWIKVCDQLKDVTDNLSTLGTDAFPVFQMANVRDGFTEKQLAHLKERGCCIIRGVLSDEEAQSSFKDLKQFVGDNKGKITGWPVESPAMLLLYNSPTQVAIRTHPNQLLIQKQLNALYHDRAGETSPEPLSYTDAARIRPSGQPFLGLGPHIDAGSLTRWADPAYRKVYDRIFSGFPEEHDAYDLNARKNADQFLFKAKAHSAVFRSFQGWTALTPASPSCGTLMLYPNVSSVIAYLLLRPFFSPPEQEDELMDASKWKFDPTSTWFPGTMKDQSQRLSPSSHPHLRPRECVSYIPKMNAGDTVWWHTDVS
jgi:hypothetical protein